MVCRTQRQTLIYSLNYFIESNASAALPNDGNAATLFYTVKTKGIQENDSVEKKVEWYTKANYKKALPYYGMISIPK